MNTENQIHGISAEWDGAELELTMTVDAIAQFASALSQADGDAFVLDSYFKGARSRTTIVVEEAKGPAKVSVVDDRISIKGGSNVLAQIAQNVLGLKALAEAKGVSHMHFDHVSDEDLIGKDSAGLIISIE